MLIVTLFYLLRCWTSLFLTNSTTTIQDSFFDIINLILDINGGEYSFLSNLAQFASIFLLI